MIMAVLNPYWGKDFFQFMLILGTRFLQWMSGQLPLEQMASDEVQLLVLIGVALSAALVGVFLVLKKMSMLANSLSHTILLGIVLTYLLMLAFSSSQKSGAALIDLKTLFIAALITGAITTFFTQFFTQVLKLQEDASIGLVFTSFFALGIVLVTLFTRNTHIGIEAVMGNVDGLHFDDLKMMFFIFVLNCVITLLFFKEFKITAFDRPLAQALGLFPAFFNYLLMIQVAATSIAAFRAVGVLLFLAFLVGPVLSARLLTDSLKKLLFIAGGIGALCALVGVALSRHLLTVYQMPLSTAGLVVVLIACAYILLLLVNPKRGLIPHYYKRKRWKKHSTQ